jgi:hypothetical protein
MLSIHRCPRAYLILNIKITVLKIIQSVERVLKIRRIRITRIIRIRRRMRRIRVKIVYNSGFYFIWVSLR